MPTKKYSNNDLGIGSLVRDVQTGDLGLLVDRVDLFDNIEGHEPIWVWSMTWTGPATDSHNRHIPYIEEAIVGLLNGGVWELKGNETD
tara:strand:+ start:688 stop:951 length:264 start_codon:yes stop_codon:yes gene_type:complete